MAALRGPHFVGAKLRSALWTWKQRKEIGNWRRRVQRYKVVGDLALLAKMRWTYPVAQMLTVGSRNSAPGREPGTDHVAGSHPQD